MDVAFPYALDREGRTASVGRDAHVRQMLEQLLFTRPGERVMRPDFGCGLADLLFGPNSPELAAAVGLTCRTAVNQWLGDVIDVAELTVTADDSKLFVRISYVVRSTGEAVATTMSAPRPS
jgi:phage baseplate assembly protein W